MSRSMVETNRILSAYFAKHRPIMYQKGEVIVEGGVSSEYIYFIKSGFVNGYAISDEGNYSLLLVKGSADLFPLATIFEPEINKLYYEAVTDVVVQRAREADFETDLENDHQLAQAALSKTLSILRDYIQRIENLAIPGARQRIIYYLLYLLERFGAKSTGSREVIFVPVTYSDLADSLNLTRETTNRIVSQLASEGLVAKSRSHITVTDKSRLQTEIVGVIS